MHTLNITLFYRMKRHPTVDLQWLEHLWDHGNLLETWIVRATEGLIIAQGQKANENNLGMSFPSSIK